VGDTGLDPNQKHRAERWWGVKLGLLLAVVIAIAAAASH